MLEAGAHAACSARPCRSGRCGRRARSPAPPAANAVICAWSFTPGSSSTPLATSTANGRTAAIASATFVRRQAAAEDQRAVARMLARQLPGERLARPALLAGHVRVEQVEVGLEGAQVADVGAPGDARGLDHLRAGAARGLGAVDGPLVAVELQQREPERVGGLGDLVEMRVDEHAGDLGAAVQRGADRLGLRARAAARRAGPEDHPDRPGAQLGRVLGVLQAGDAAELDRWGRRDRTRPHRRRPRRRRARRRCVCDGACLGAVPSVTRHLLLVAAAQDPEADSVARLVLGDLGRQVAHRVDRVAVERLDHVAAEHDARAAELALDRAAVQAGLRRRSVRLDRLHEHALVDLQLQVGERGVDRRAGDAEVGVHDRARLLELRQQLLGRVDRHREADPDVAVARAAGDDLRVDADHAAGRVEQRAARVAGVDRRVGLDHVLDREAVRRRDLALERGDDAGRERAVEPERVADREHRVADLRGAASRRAAAARA